MRLGLVSCADSEILRVSLVEALHEQVFVPIPVRLEHDRATIRRPARRRVVAVVERQSPGVVETPASVAQLADVDVGLAAVVQEREV